jgi:hypothetical protein
LLKTLEASLSNHAVLEEWTIIKGWETRGVSGSEQWQERLEWDGLRLYALFSFYLFDFLIVYIVYDH